LHESFIILAMQLPEIADNVPLEAAMHMEAKFG
jgi:hypothetical protein